MIHDLKNIRILALLISMFFCQYSSFLHAQAEYIIELDPVTGTYTRTGPPIAGVAWVIPGERAYDENTGIYYLPSPRPDRIFSINASNTSIINNPVLLPRIRNYEIDKTTGILYGIHKNVSGTFFGSINQVTGVFTQVGNGLGGFSVSQGMNTFNENTHTYYCLTTSETLLSINSQNGNIISKPNLNLSSTEDIISISFDNSTNQLYGVLIDRRFNLHYLAKIDPTRGIVTKMGKGKSLGVGRGTSAIDQNRQLLFFAHHTASNSAYNITTYKLSDGSILHDNRIHPLCRNENIHNLEYDNIKGKLYAVHWGYSFTPLMDTVLCQGDTYTIDVSIPGATYLWHDNSTSSSYTVSQAGIYSVEVNVNGCVFRDTVHITYNQLPALDLGNDTSLCVGDVLLLDATISNTTASYLWQDNSTKPYFIAYKSGTYWVDVTTCGNTKRDSIDVFFEPVPEVELGNDTVLCEGDTIRLDVTFPNADYIWEDNSNNPVRNIIQSGTYWVESNIKDCKFRDTINLNFLPNPLVDLGSDTNLCDGEKYVLDAKSLNYNSSNEKYLWQDQSTNQTYIVFKGGTYWVKTTVNKCSGLDTTSIIYQSLPIVELGDDTSLCKGEVLTLKASYPTASYLWNDNSTDSTFEINKEGRYSVRVTVNNCIFQDSIYVKYDSIPVVDLGDDRALCEGRSIVLDVSNEKSSYLWQDNSTDRIFEVMHEGVYWVEVTNYCGVNFDTVSFELEDCNCYIYVPTAFSPNNDNLNDQFFATITDCDYTQYSLIVYNRWGEMLYETKNPHQAWNGLYKGEECPTGVYVYFVFLTYPNGRSITKSGNVTLVR